METNRSHSEREAPQGSAHPGSAPQVRLGIVTVGDEILAGRIQDSLSSTLSIVLSREGYTPRFHISVGDAPGQLSALLKRTQQEDDSLSCDAVIVTGGLGPTDDDRTRREVADCCGVELAFRQESWEEIVAYFQRRGLSPVAGNRRQGMFPVGAEVLKNSLGTAPGFSLAATSGQRPWRCWVLPGVPAEVEGMFVPQVLPQLLKAFPVSRRPEGEVLRFFGIPESRLDQWILSLIPESTVDYHIRITGGEAEVILPAGISLQSQARQRFGERYLGLGLDSLATRIVQLGTASGRSVSVVESCTGGLVAAALTDCPGASAMLERSWVTYSNESKVSEVGVAEQTLQRHGAVSARCACEMARGGRAAADSDLAVAITGIAGPAGGTEEKPVGTTYLALATDTGVWWRRFDFSGSRAQVRTRATATALYALWCGLHQHIPHKWQPQADLD